MDTGAYEEPVPQRGLRDRLADAAAGQFGVVRRLLWSTFLAAVVGVLCGVVVYVFLWLLRQVTITRLDHPWLLWLLPAAGLVIGLAYHFLGGEAAQGNNLLLDEIHEPRRWVPRRMAPLVLIGTLITQLFGGSAGREGTALQMSGSVTDAFSRAVGLGPRMRRILLIASLAAGFGAVFGVPIAGAVFALEVQTVGTLQYEALVPALTASIVGDQVVRHLGWHHEILPQLGSVALSPARVGQLAVAGIACGLLSALFVETEHRVRRLAARTLAWPPLRPVLGGVAVILMTLLVGNRDYNGLSLSLEAAAFAGLQVAAFAFLIKLVFTAVTLGTGFPGGEVTPLFVMGATLGATLNTVFGVEGPLLVAVCFVAVFAGAANAPLACTIMAAELFGAHAIVPAAVVCVLSFIFSTHRSIYTSQRGRRTPRIH